MAGLTLDGRTVFVTGASSGIGEATARTLAIAGARIALVARRKDRLEALADDLAQVTGRQDVAVAVPADLTDEAGIDTAFETAEAALGRIDILANIAGLMLVAPILGTDTGQWRKMVEINFMGLMLLTQRAATKMIGRRNGHIVNVSSLAARYTSANFGVYCATKYGVAAFTDTLRKELIGTGVRTTEIMPGIVESELIDQIEDSEIRESVQKWSTSVSPLAPDDIADAVLYAVTRPPNVAVSEMIVRPTNQEL